MFSRVLRLKLVAGLGIALGMPFLTAATASAISLGTSTSIGLQSATQTCSASTATNTLTTTLSTVSVTVTSNTGVPTGTVTIEDSGSGTAVALATGTVSSTGTASFTFYLPNGVHILYATFAGTGGYGPSTSTSSSFTISAQCTTELAVSVTNLAPASSPVNTLIAGESGTSTVTVTPSQAFVESLITLGTPGYVTVSCSGLPDESQCIFTPSELQFSPGDYAALTSTMVLSTEAEGTGMLVRPGVDPRGGQGVALALLLPGMFGLGTLAWGTRRRRWLSRLSLLALLALVTTLGTTACNPRYYYLNHGPPQNPATPSGTYAVAVTAQYSNGVVAITQPATLVLTVK